MAGQLEELLVKFRTTLLAVLAVAVTLAGCSGPPAARVDGKATSVADEMAPDFTLSTANGEAVSLSDSAGRVRLIDFWATWCPPCREEVPMLKRLHETYTEQGLTILAISDESAEAVGSFVEKHEIPFINLVDTEEVAYDYQVLGLPTAVLIDRDGRRIATYFGPKPKRMEEQIRELLDLGPAT